MEECEICGKPTEKLFVINLEGARVMVCERCSEGKKVLNRIDLSKKASRLEQYKAKKLGTEADELIDGYGTAIRKARERMGLPLKVLAEKINEKESTLLRVEEQKTLPSVTLTKKIEKELGIKLTEASGNEENVNVPGRSSPITLGDAAIKHSKDKEE